MRASGRLGKFIQNQRPERSRLYVFFDDGSAGAPVRRQGTVTISRDAFSQWLDVVLLRYPELILTADNPGESACSTNFVELLLSVKSSIVRTG